MKTQAQNILLTLNELYDGDNYAVFHHIEERKPFEIKNYDDINAITIVESKLLKLLCDKQMPLTLVAYYEGDISVLDDLVEHNEEYVCLIGKNRFNIPTNRLITLCDKGHAINIANKVKIWFAPNKNKKIHMMKFPYLSSKLAITEIMKTDTQMKNADSAIAGATCGNSEIYIVASTEPSYNNKQIKYSAHLLDCYEDLELR